VKTAAAVTLADLPSLVGVRALIVDDQDEARELLATVLEDRGAEVAAVGSGREALAWLKARLESEPPDVFICDIGMPEEDGYAVIRKVRALETSRGIHLRRRIPAIALTAFAQPEDRLRTLQAGFQIHVAKPVEPSELIVVIDTLVRGGAA
jgi:ATP-binding cassette subfamily B protein